MFPRNAHLVVSALALATFAGEVAAQITIQPVSTPFIDITAGGTNVPGIIGDDSAHTILAADLTAAGFSGNALLGGAVNVVVGGNGTVVWNPPSAVTASPFLNANILTMAPSATNGNGVRQLIAPFWDDLFPLASSGASIQWKVMNGDLLIEWANVNHFGEAAGGVTFELIVYHNGAPGLVDLVYNDTLFSATSNSNDGASASIGYKNNGVAPFGNDLQWSFNQAGAVTGYASNGGGHGPHALRIARVPEPVALVLFALGAMPLRRRRMH